MADSKPEAARVVERGELEETSFENIINFRDVGKTINEFLAQRYVPSEAAYLRGMLTTCPRQVTEGKIFRSARPGGYHLRIVYYALH
jgi:hypothetical protein